MRRRISLESFTPVEADLEEVQIDWGDNYDSQSSDEQLAKLQAELAEAMEQERHLREAQLQRIEAQRQRIAEMRTLAGELREVEERINSLIP